MKVGNATAAALAISKPGTTNCGHAGTLHALDLRACKRVRLQHQLRVNHEEHEDQRRRVDKPLCRQVIRTPFLILPALRALRVLRGDKDS
jgi:hypothetical protein